MNDNEIIEKVNSVFEVSFEIEKEKLQPRMNIFEDLGLDSLDIVDLVVALQRMFNIKIRDDERVRAVRTLGDIYGFIGILQSEGVVNKDDA